MKTVERAVEVGDGRAEVEHVGERGVVEVRADLGVGADELARSRAPRPTRASRSAARGGTPRRARARARRARAAAGARRRGRARPRGSAPCAPGRRRARRRSSGSGRACSRARGTRRGSRSAPPTSARCRARARAARSRGRRPRRRAHDAREPRDPLGDLRVPLVRHRRRALHARSRTAPRPRAPRCGRGAGSRSRTGRATSRTSASVESSSACRSRAITCVETGSGSSPSRSHAMRSTSGSIAAYVPTVPESWPTRHASSARSSRGRAPRSSSNAQPASFQPNVVGSAWIPCERPMQIVCAVLLGAPHDGAERARRCPRAISAPASRICSASAVSTTSDEVSP